MFSFNNSANILIGKSVSRTANVQYTDPSNATTYIKDGEIVVLDSTGAVLTPGNTIANTKSISLVQGRGTNTDQPLVFSARITGLNVTSFTGVDGSLFPEQEQIFIYGYNPFTATGSLDVTSLDTYTLRLQYKHDKAFWSEQKMIRTYFYEATTPTQKGLAFTNAHDINIDPASLVSAVVFCDETATFVAQAQSLIVSNGSPIVSTSAHTIVAGDVVRIGTNAGAATDPVYTVSSVTTTTITLNMPYQGASGTVAAADWGAITVGAADNYGVQLTGKVLRFQAGFWKYVKVMWDTVLTNYSATTTFNVQAAAKGNGVWKEVQELEWFLTGYEGAINRMMVPMDTSRTDTVQGTTYDMITINYFDTSENYPVSGTHPAPQMLYIFVPQGAPQTTDILAQLNPYMASLPASFNAVAV